MLQANGGSITNGKRFRPALNPHTLFQTLVGELGFGFVSQLSHARLHFVTELPHLSPN
jgi:hypothetical protein